jgi:hypothetical protein
MAVGVFFCEDPRIVDVHGRFFAGLDLTGCREFTRLAAALLFWGTVSDADRRWNG